MALSGTAPIGDDGRAAHVGDIYAQTTLCLSIIWRAIEGCGCKVEDVARTRVMLTDISRWEDAARAHGEVFRVIRRACTFFQVARFNDPEWLVEVEADSVCSE